MNEYFVKNHIETPAGKVPVVNTKPGLRDRAGMFMVRASIKRMNYIVKPGLYAAGSPGENSNVFVSANYKLSFDALRRELYGMDAWILVLDTKGINVWCAAGKGTFGTGELVNRIKSTKLEAVIKHRNLIVPQLGATGVSAHRVKALSGFNITYGPVRAKDITAFLENGMNSTEEMRTVRFGLLDRLVLVPVEFVGGLKYLLFISALVYLLSGISAGGYSTDLARESAKKIFFNFTLIYVSSTAFGPILLPLLPGRSFSLKGFILGLSAFLVSYFAGFAGNGALEPACWLLLFSSLVSFIFMNFTGATTYTSISGVKKEMKAAVPLQAAALIFCIAITIIGRLS